MTVFWCSRCKARHAWECPPAKNPPPGEVYMLKGQSSLRYDPKLHGDFQRLLDEGYRVYDPLEPGGNDCTDTHRGSGTKVPCRHGRTWWCSQAPRKNWFPDAAKPEDRDLDAFLRKRFPGRDPNDLQPGGQP